MPTYTVTFEDHAGSTISVDVVAEDAKEATQKAAKHAHQFDETAIVGKVLKVVEIAA
jgi:hypothetical protein